MNLNHFTIKQAAEFLGITRQAVHSLVQRGLLPSIRLGPRHVLIPTSAVRRRKKNRDAAKASGGQEEA